MTSTTLSNQHVSGAMLRWLSDAYEQAQRIRIEQGERIRAIVQGRDASYEIAGSIERAWVVTYAHLYLRATPVDHLAEIAEGWTPRLWDAARFLAREDAEAVALIASQPRDAEEELQAEESLVPLPAEVVYWQSAEGEPYTADELLRAIQRGKALGPVPIIARTYQRHWEEERELYAEMGRQWPQHPVYPWLSQVKGVGDTLACKLLARLDPHKAPYAGNFWSFFGLTTVPGELYRCDLCGLERSFAIGYDVTGTHKKMGKGAECKGRLVNVPNVAVAVSKPLLGKGQRRSYDAYGKKIMWLIGNSFVKAGGPYEKLYREKRIALERERPRWADGRKHLTALRHIEKLFLAHLWQVWRQALGLPTPDPWVVAFGGHDPSSLIDPWSMVDEP